MLRKAAILVPLVLAAGTVPLGVACGDDEEEARATTGTTTGLLVSVAPGRLVVAPANNAPEEEFSIRPVDRERFDLFHLQQHAAQRLPVTVHWTIVDGRRYAERVDDA